MDGLLLIIYLLAFVTTVMVDTYQKTHHQEKK